MRFAAALVVLCAIATQGLDQVGADGERDVHMLVEDKPLLAGLTQASFPAHAC